MKKDEKDLNDFNNHFEGGAKFKEIELLKKSKEIIKTLDNEKRKKEEIYKKQNSLYERYALKLNTIDPNNVKKVLFYDFAQKKSETVKSIDADLGDVLQDNPMIFLDSIKNEEYKLKELKEERSYNILGAIIIISLLLALSIIISVVIFESEIIGPIVVSLVAFLSFFYFIVFGFKNLHLIEKSIKLKKIEPFKKMFENYFDSDSYKKSKKAYYEKNENKIKVEEKDLETIKGELKKLDEKASLIENNILKLENSLDSINISENYKTLPIILIMLEYLKENDRNSIDYVYDNFVPKEIKELKALKDNATNSLWEIDINVEKKQKTKYDDDDNSSSLYSESLASTTMV